MTLNKKQKTYLFTEILDQHDLIKIFETTDLKWLCSQKVVIKNEDSHGWKELWCDGELVTSLNFATYGSEWNKNLDELSK